MPKGEQNPFDVWFSRTLKSEYERVLHEPLPSDILAALPPAPSRISDPARRSV